jgi:hypothetical protein
MDLNGSLHNFFLMHLKKIRQPTLKSIDDFINLLTLINQIIDQNIEENTILAAHSSQDIKFEFTNSLFAKILYEIIANFNHPNVLESTKLIEFKRLFLLIITKTNYADSFKTMLEIILQLK